MPSPSDSPDSSGFSSFDPYTTDTQEDQTSGPHKPENTTSDSTRVDPVQNYGSNGALTEAQVSKRMSGRKRKRAAAQQKEATDQGTSSSEDTLGDSQIMDSDPQPSPYGFDRNKRAKSDGTRNLGVPLHNDSSLRGIAVNSSMVPEELWQYIFTFLPPSSLGRAMRVNKYFKSLLTPDDTELSGHRPTLGLLQYLSPSSIWSASRKAFSPGMPRPLSSLNEPDMWRLVLGTACQFCSKPGSIPPDSPEHNDVQIIWPFRVRACKQCMYSRTEKEVDLLFSSLPSLLVPGLPFAFFTPSMHHVSSVAFRTGPPPSGLTKHFLKSDIDQLRVKFDEVKALGPAAAEEWIKGLDGATKAKLQDAARFEQWEMTGGLTSVRTAQHHSSDPSVISPVDAGINTSSMVGSTSGHSTPHTSNSGTIKQGSPAVVTRPGFKSTAYSSSLDSYQHFPSAQNSNHQKPGERNLRQVNEAKASRKAEIERRCLELQPPLTPGVLTHMDSFSAAIQIPHPFTDRDWAILRPRLLAQRNFAERKEQERIRHDQILQARSEERRQQDAQLREAKELLDKEWDDAQAPIKERMVTYADEIIREGWRGGDAVTKEKCPKFAADVLIYVRDRFYSDIAKHDALARSAGNPIVEDQPNAPPTRKLVLENMKFIFDTKIKPLTEKFQKELFLCNGCENNAKFYGFEGVVQHYAAKHTNVLSLGSVVVHWRAEWPETPPFNPNPNAAKALLYSMPRAGMGQAPMGYPNPAQGPMYMNPEAHMPPEGGPAYPHPSPGPYNRTPYGTPCAYGTGPYRPPSPPPPQFYPGPNYAYSPPQPGYAATTPYEPHAQPPPPNPVYGSPYPGQAYPPPFPPPDSRGQAPYPPPPYGPQSGPFGAPYASTQQSRRGPQSNQPYGVYKAQIDEMAKIARATWNGTSGIKDLPHSVRAYVLIHHVVARFTEKFGHGPTLSLLADGINGHPQMKPLRNLSGLMCKACTGASYQPGVPLHELGRGDGKIYTLPALVSHFQSAHIERPASSASLETGPEADWKSDMLALPSNSAVLELVDAPGMDENKLRLFAAAFPWAFPSAATEDQKPVPQRRAASRNSLRDVVTRPSPHRGIEVAVDDFPSFVESPHTDGGKPLEPPRDDEYDPHRPAFVEPIRDHSGRPKTHRFKPKHVSVAEPGYVSSRGMRMHDEDTGPHKVRIGGIGDAKDGLTYSAGNLHSLQRDRPPKIEYDEPYAAEEEKARTPRGVSEDGEVEDAPPSQKERTRGSPPAEGTTAAERFLSNFAPGQENDDYKVASRDFDRQVDNTSRGRWLDAPDHEGHRWHAEGGSGGTANSSLGGTPTQATHPRAWGRRAKSPAAGGYHEYESRQEFLDGAGMLRHGDDRSPVHGDLRRGRGALAYSESRHTPDHPSRRPHSRFDRYEAQRQNAHRTRSRSPLVHDPVALEQTYYRDREPKPRFRQRPTYPSHPLEDYYDRAPVDQQPVTYTRLPRRGHYQYVEDPRYAPEPPYDGAVEYVAVPPGEPQPTGAYYIERPVQREIPKEYVDYDMDYSQPPSGRHTQYYPSSTMPPSMQGGRQPRYR